MLSLLSEDHAIGLSTFTIMAGLGGSLGYVMGALDWGRLGDYHHHHHHHHHHHPHNYHHHHHLCCNLFLKSFFCYDETLTNVLSDKRIKLVGGTFSGALLSSSFSATLFCHSFVMMKHWQISATLFGGHYCHRHFQQPCLVSAILFGGHIRLVFTLVLFIFLGCVGITLTSFRSYNHFHQISQFLRPDHAMIMIII